MSWLSRVWRRAISSSLRQLFGKARKSDFMRLGVIAIVWLLVVQPIWWLAALIIAVEIVWLLSLIATLRKER
jgi:hypothetical protein